MLEVFSHSKMLFKSVSHSYYVQAWMYCIKKVNNEKCQCEMFINHMQNVKPAVLYRNSYWEKKTHINTSAFHRVYFQRWRSTSALFINYLSLRESHRFGIMGARQHKSPPATGSGIQAMSLKLTLDRDSLRQSAPTCCLSVIASLTSLFWCGLFAHDE